MIVNKNNSKSTNLKYIFELQKSNYNEIKMSTTDINLAAKTLTKLLKNDKIDEKEYKILSKAVVSKYIYNEFEEKLDKYFIKSLYNVFRRDQILSNSKEKENKNNGLKNEDSTEEIKKEDELSDEVLGSEEVDPEKME